MHKLIYFVLGASLAALVVGSLSSSLQIHEKKDIAPTGWLKRGRTDAKKSIPMRIGLTQRNLDAAHNLLMDISDPHSPHYGNHLTAEQVVDLFKPSNDSVLAVKAWLEASGIEVSRVTHTSNKAWLVFDATVKEAETLLDTEYFDYDHPTRTHIVIGCDEYKLPAHIRRHVDFITPGVKFSQLLNPRETKCGVDRSRSEIRSTSGTPLSLDSTTFKSATPNSKDLSGCGQWMTPACIAALYNIPPATKAHANNSYGIYESGLRYGGAELDMFFANFTPHIPQGTRPLEMDVDSVNPDAFARYSEPDLDLQVSYPIVYPQNITNIQVDDYYWNYVEGRNRTQGFLNTFLDAIDGSYCTSSAFGESGDDPIHDPQYPDNNTCSTCDPANNYRGQRQCGVFKPTNVISISYGTDELELPVSYNKRQCLEFLKLGLQGVSIVVSSGDSGVGLSPCTGPDKKAFLPVFPASCPYVTAVGATLVPPNRTTSNPETSLFDPRFVEVINPDFILSSGGGFSTIFPRPDYQNETISIYFQDFNPPYPYYETNDAVDISKNGGLYNRAGRGYPDVAANGRNIAIYSTEGLMRGAGTSASAPIFASMLVRINEERLSAGKSLIGFVNPVLYAHPEIFNDITEGENPGCSTNGFNAVRGWDPVSGLGTPNYPKMLNVFMSLP